MSLMSFKKGFTLIELVMIIVILGILSVVAIPRFFDLSGQANTAAERGVVGGVRAGISTFFAQNQNFPAALGGTGTCTTAAPCFGTVLAQGGISETTWSVAGSTFTGPAGGTYVYESTGGSFID